MLLVRRLRDGSCRLTLPEEDAAVLLSLPGRLRSLFERPDFRNKVIQRLFPPGYTDKKKQAEYRELLGDDLRRRKLQSIEAFEETFREARHRGDRVVLQIRATDFDLWLSFVNDMRLVLATELDIQDEGWGEDFDPTHPQAPELALLHYLSWLQEELLGA
jgi:hypothetical protein